MMLMCGGGGSQSLESPSGLDPDLWWGGTRRCPPGPQTWNRPGWETSEGDPASLPPAGLGQRGGGATSCQGPSLLLPLGPPLWPGSLHIRKDTELQKGVPTGLEAWVGALLPASPAGAEPGLPVQQPLPASPFQDGLETLGSERQPGCLQSRGGSSGRGQTQSCRTATPSCPAHQQG